MLKKKGYSILELVLVLGAIALISGAIFTYYQKQKQNTQIEETTQQINTIFNSADDFLTTMKTDGSEQSGNPISMQILKNALALPINLGEVRETAESQAISASISSSTSNSISSSVSTSVSTSTSASISNSISSSVSASKSASTSASKSASTSASISASTSASLSASTAASISTSNSVSASRSASTSSSVSASTSTSVSASKSASTSASVSTSISASNAATAAKVGISASQAGVFYLTYYEYVLGNCLDCVEYGNESMYELQAYVPGLSVTSPKGTYSKAVSKSAAQDLALMKFIYTMAQATRIGTYGTTYKGNSVESIIQVILNNISSIGLITWYSPGNATVSYITSKFKYTG